MQILEYMVSELSLPSKVGDSLSGCRFLEAGRLCYMAALAALLGFVGLCLEGLGLGPTSGFIAGLRRFCGPL